MTKLSDILALGFSDDELMRHLPPILAEIARVIGVRKAIAFGLKYGGGQFFIPDNIEGTRPRDLVELIGLDDAAKLHRHLYERYIFRFEVPNSLAGAVFRRLRGIKLLREGKSYRAIAQEVGANRSTVKKWYEDFVRPAQ